MKVEIETHDTVEKYEIGDTITLHFGNSRVVYTVTEIIKEETDKQV